MCIRDREYHGVNVSITGYLDRTKVPVSIDIGFGDVIYPERMKIDVYKRQVFDIDVD